MIKATCIPQWGDMLRSLNGDWLSLHPDPATLPAYTYWTDDFSATTLGRSGRGSMKTPPTGA